LPEPAPKKARRLHAQLAGGVEGLSAHGLGRVRGHTQQADAELVRRLDLMDGADAWEDQRGDRGPLGRVHGGGEELSLVGAAAPVGHRGAAKAVAVGDLDDGDAGTVHRRDHAPHLLSGELVGAGVRAIAQRGVDDADHATTAC
jgi:hypothetical protein